MRSCFIFMFYDGSRDVRGKHTFTHPHTPNSHSNNGWLLNAPQPGFTRRQFITVTVKSRERMWRHSWPKRDVYTRDYSQPVTHCGAVGGDTSWLAELSPKGTEDGGTSGIFTATQLLNSQHVYEIFRHSTFLALPSHFMQHPSTLIHPQPPSHPHFQGKQSSLQVNSRTL